MSAETREKATAADYMVETTTGMSLYEVLTLCYYWSHLYNKLRVYTKY